MPSQMAVPKPNLEISAASTDGHKYPSKNGAATPHGHQNGGDKRQLSRVEAVVVQLYGQGVERRAVAKLMLKFLVPPDGNATVKERLSLAVKRLKQMEERKWFRDALWDRALIQADLETPQIVAGLTRKARRGRVDAAKMVLGLTGRYDEHGDIQATQINISFGGEVPRPANRPAIESHNEADEIEDGEWEA